MLLVEWTDSRGLSRISNRAHSLDHLWRGRVLSLGNLRFGLEHETGGDMQPRFSTLRINNTFFEDAWLPQTTATVAIKHTLGKESDSVELLKATAYLKQFYRGSVEYRLYTESADVLVDKNHTFDDDLLTIIEWACDASRLNYTVDSTAAARASAFTISHTVTNETTYLLDTISGMAAAGCFGFMRSGSTLTLVDLLTDNGTHKCTGYQFLPNAYPTADPIKELTGGGETVTGPYSFGASSSVSTIYHDDATEIASRLTDMLSLFNAGTYTLTLFPIEHIPQLGEKLYWASTYPGPPNTITNGWLKVHSLTYNFDSRRIIVEGPGGCSS